MKQNISLLAFLAATVYATAIPGDGWELRRADEIDFSQVEIVDLVVTDFDGAKYTGTAQTVVDEIQAVHGEIVATNGTSAAVEPRDLEARNNLNCNWGAWVYTWNACVEGIGYLERLGDRRCGVAPTPPGHPAVCARVSCSRKCGMFLCNKVNTEVTVRCGDIPYDINDIANRCGDTFGRRRGAKDFRLHYIGLGESNC